MLVIFLRIKLTRVYACHFNLILRTDLNTCNSEIRYTKIVYFPDRGCVHTLLTLYIYATGMHISTGWLTIKYPSRQYAISPQAAA